MFEVKQAELWHAEEIAGRLRQADKDEVWASHHYKPYEAIVISFEMSLFNHKRNKHFCWTMFWKGKPEAIFGLCCGCMLTGIYVPWLLGTDKIDEFKKSFLQASKRYVDIMLNDNGEYLVGYVDARNTKSIKWLKHIGFEVQDNAKPYGKDKLPFHFFSYPRFKGDVKCV